MRRLKLEILALIRYPCVGMGDNLALFRSTFAPSFAPRQYALMFAKFLLRYAIGTRVRNPFASRINDKRIQSDIYTQRGMNRDCHRGSNFNDDCGIPTGGLLGDSQCLNFAIGQRAVVSNLQMSNFGDDHTGLFLVDIANQSLCQVTEIMDRYRPSPLQRGKPGSSTVLTRRKNALYALSKRRNAS